MKVKSPCLNCEDRFPACHDTCEKYKEYKAESMADKTARHKWEQAYKFGRVRSGMSDKDFKYQCRKTKNKVFKDHKK